MLAQMIALTPAMVRTQLEAAVRARLGWATSGALITSFGDGALRVEIKRRRIMLRVEEADAVVGNLRVVGRIQIVDEGAPVNMTWSGGGFQGETAGYPIVTVPIVEGVGAGIGVGEATGHAARLAANLLRFGTVFPSAVDLLGAVADEL